MLYSELPKDLLAWTTSDHFSTSCSTFCLTLLMVDESSYPTRTDTTAFFAPQLLSRIKHNILCRKKWGHSNYRNFRTIIRTADYPQRSIFVTRGKNVQHITRTGLLPAPQNRKNLATVFPGQELTNFGEMNIPCCCLQSRRSIAFSAKNWLLIMQP